MAVAAIAVFTDKDAVRKLRDHLSNGKFTPDSVSGPHGRGDGVYYVVYRGSERYRVPHSGKVTKERR